MAGTFELSAARMVDLERCPIDDPDSVPRCRIRAGVSGGDYLEDGLCVLPEFLRPEALELLAKEANERLGDAWFCKSTHNVYLTKDSTGNEATDASDAANALRAPDASDASDASYTLDGPRCPGPRCGRAARTHLRGLGAP